MNQIGNVQDDNYLTQSRRSNIELDEEIELHFNVKRLRVADEECWPVVYIEESESDDSSLTDIDPLWGLEPVAILKTLNRGQHAKYVVRLTNGSTTTIDAHRMKKIAPDVLGHYQKDKRRIAVAMTRQRQRSGESPKIPGRGRGRGRGSYDRRICR